MLWLAIDMVSILCFSHCELIQIGLLIIADHCEVQSVLKGQTLAEFESLLMTTTNSIPF